MQNEMTNWQDLIVTDADQQMNFRLGDYLADPANPRDDIELNSDGSMGAWAQFFVSAPGENADCDTPRGDVDWEGFAAALGRVNA